MASARAALRGRISPGDGGAGVRLEAAADRPGQFTPPSFAIASIIARDKSAAAGYPSIPYGGGRVVRQGECSDSHAFAEPRPTSGVRRWNEPSTSLASRLPSAMTTEAAIWPVLSTNFEPETLSVFAAFCRPRSNVLDIGSNIGLTAIALGNACHRGRVFAIEASPETFQYLESNVRRAGLANVRCENLAASSTSGELEVTFVPSYSSGAFVSEKYQLPGHSHKCYKVRRLRSTNTLRRSA